ncbi:MAG TPA: SDR family NAD(P)-dependent oxidoreductase [Kofleriaceae bacterium]|nr:SDR family NAD(P)-dependent oxidoreductase [Kofleriaceae bacterium]
MQGKTVLITGGTSGIGRATAEALADRGARVVVLARDPGRAAQAIAEMQHGTARDLHTILADLSSLASVRAAADEFRTRFGVLDVLVNNAAVQQPTRQTTADGFELHFGVNYLAHYLLTRSLLDLLVARATPGSPSRIVNVGAMQAGAVLDFDDLQLTRSWDRNTSITRAKMALFLFTRALARRYRDQVVANVADPGLVKTPYHDDSPRFLRAIVRIVGADSTKAAETNIFLASAAEAATLTDGFYLKRKLRPWKGQALDAAAADRLWLDSAHLVGLPDGGQATLAQPGGV